MSPIQYALVSGGSEGIGFAIAMELAERNYNLILVARHEQALANAKTKIEDACGISVHTIAADVSNKKGAETVADWCNEQKIPLKMLFNVAGLGGNKDFLSVSLDDSLYMLQLNTVSAIALSYALLPLLKKNSPSFIINTSSMAGFAPIAGKNIYAASKSAVLFFSYSLRQQLKKDNVSVSCLCPGPVFTKPSIEAETTAQLGWLGKQMAVRPEYAARVAVKKALRGKLVIVPGFIASVLSAIIRCLPAGTINFIAGRTSKSKI